MNEFSSTYDPKGIEDKWYAFWIEKKYFTPDMKSNKPPYTIMIPLPNVTGRLTLGHVLNNSDQDILIRYKKFSNYETLWMSGMDHAGIATQVVVEEKLLEQGIRRKELGREKFVAAVWQWKEEYANIIRTQLQRLGCALDWSRECFTLSEEYSKRVIKVFIELYNKGLIYRGEYIINWCPRCLTALSDEQVETEEEMGKLYYIKYPIVGTKTFITVATTRPETMLGDTGVCVNPKDKRYKTIIGKKALLPIMEREIPIIADDYVDPDFGTGALKVTPAHDPFDFELAKKHNLEFINIMNPDATLNENTKRFNTVDRYTARKEVIEQLKNLKLLKKIENYKLPLSKCERCKTATEPRISKQWFVKMKPLAGPALEVVQNGTVKLYPKRWTNLYSHWLENVHDWCISRQLWWGHRIPAYYCKQCFNPDDTESKKGIIVSATKPEKCPTCGSTDVYQDEDVLDTWFSSWLWPFATLGWPSDTEDFRRFYPTQTLVTGWDIIYLWVARMIMAGLEFTDQIPFNNVLFHPMVRDEKGRKMSKSLGNSPDPMDLVDNYGADALRFGLQLITPKEQDVLFSEKSIEVGRKFCNKLWNASRLIWMHHKDDNESLLENVSMYDSWILHEFNVLLDSVKNHYANFELNAIAKEMYAYVWHTFCDWYLEFIKIVPTHDTPKYLLKQILIILNPFMPFITEEIYHKFHFAKESIMQEQWPEKIDIKHDIKQINAIKKLIEEIRNIRGMFNIKSKEKLNVLINTSTDDHEGFLKDNGALLQKLARIERIEFNKPVTGSVASIIMPDIQCYVKLSGIDVDKEKRRLAKEIQFLSQRIDEIKYRLNNPQYMSQAGDEIKNRENERLENFLKKREGIVKAIEKL
ncbi:MAG: valine--tRNA ligase [candidate division WOR-3 bacterium]|nr:MAG: valine--tRNA ligase [candidate division WOR-3 bacterium]